MASVQEHLKLKRVSIDDWSIRERLCLSSSVLRSGDQNWMSVSRAVKVFGEPNRPDDWFSQKNCAVQYSTMLEKAETPKRKKRSSSSDKDTPVETVGEIIMRKCTSERIEELQKIMEADKAAYLKLQKEVLLLQAGNVSNEQLAAWAQEMDNEDGQKEVEAQKHCVWLVEREKKKAQLERAWKPLMSTPTTRRKAPQALDTVAEATRDERDNVAPHVPSRVDRPPSSPTSPFLTSLLKNPSPSKPASSSSILHSAITSQRSSTPTITSLLSSSPGIPTQTLSMLLQLPPAQLDNAAAAVPHQPQHQPLLVTKVSETDEILDVVVEDMEPIEIGLEEIIADLEQAAASHEQVKREHEPPTNVDTFHKIFDDFYAMNVVKPKDPVEVKPSEGGGAAVVEPSDVVTPSVEPVGESGVMLGESEVMLGESEVMVCESEVMVGENEVMVGKSEVMLGESEVTVPEEKCDDKAVAEVNRDDATIKQEPVDSATSETVVASETEAQPAEEKPCEDSNMLAEDVAAAVERDIGETIVESLVAAVVEASPVADVETRDKSTADEVTQEAVQVKEEQCLEEREDVEEPEVSEPTRKLPDSSDDAVEPSMRRQSDAGDDATTCEVKVEDGCSDAESEENVEELAAREAVAGDVDKMKADVSGMEQTPGSRRLIRRTGTPAIDSLPGSPASVTTDEEKEYRAWKKAIMLVWNSLAAHKYASLFYKPITDDLAPEYSHRVRGPVDLSTIKRHIETGVVKSTSEFHRDVLRMFVNAAMYNKTNKAVYNMAASMERDSLQQINEFISTQRLIQSPGDSGATRRETRTTDPNAAANPYKRKRESDAGKAAKKR